MAEKESQEQVVHNTEEPQQEKQKKPRRRSFFQISKGQMISTKELWLQKLKPNSANQKRAEELEAPLTSPVELPHIEQLQPINTDISSEIQFHQHQSDIEQAAGDATDQINDIDAQPPNNESSEDEKQQQGVEKAQTASGNGTSDDVAVVDPQHKKDQPIVKRSSILLKFLFPKKVSSTSTDDVIVTEATITENHHQAELGAVSDIVEPASNTDKEDSIEKVDENHEEKTDNGTSSSDRPSSPLGRRINAFLSRIPSYKEKPSPGPGNNSKTPMDNVDEKVKKESITADVLDANYEHDKMATSLTTPTAADINAVNSIVVV